MYNKNRNCLLFLLEQEAIRNYVYVSGTNIFNMIKTMFIIYKMNLLEPET